MACISPQTVRVPDGRPQKMFTPPLKVVNKFCDQKSSAIRSREPSGFGLKEENVNNHTLQFNTRMPYSFFSLLSGAAFGRLAHHNGRGYGNLSHRGYGGILIGASLLVINKKSSPFRESPAIKSEPMKSYD